MNRTKTRAAALAASAAIIAGGLTAAPATAAPAPAPTIQPTIGATVPAPMGYWQSYLCGPGRYSGVMVGINLWQGWFYPSSAYCPGVRR